MTITIREIILQESELPEMKYIKLKEVPEDIREMYRPLNLFCRIKDSIFVCGWAGLASKNFYIEETMNHKACKKALNSKKNYYATVFIIEGGVTGKILELFHEHDKEKKNDTNATYFD